MDWVTEKCLKFCVLRQFKEECNSEACPPPPGNTDVSSTTTSTDSPSTKVTYGRPKGMTLVHYKMKKDTECKARFQITSRYYFALVHSNNVPVVLLMAPTILS